MALLKRRIFYGGVIAHCKGIRAEDFEVLTNTALGVDEKGVIAFIDSEVKSATDAARKYNFENFETIELGSNHVLLPGFVDTHTHAPQWENRGIGMDLPLLDWIDKYTRPTEMQFNDTKKAERVYQMAVQDTLRNGSTAVCYFATIHVESTKILADTCFKFGQRGFVGQPCMDQTGYEEYCNESPQQAVETTQELIRHIRSFDPNFSQVTPIVTPGFAPVLSAECAKSLSALANSQNLPIQTHLSENQAEVEVMQGLFPSAKSYTHIQDAHGVLTERTILGHCVHLNDEERQLIAERKCGVSHCPISNLNILSGDCRVRWLLDAGITVGLGCDCSGGHSSSILEVMRRASDVSRGLAFRNNDPCAILQLHELLYMATLGGARLCGISNKTGNFVVGKEFDAVVFSADAESAMATRFTFKEGESPLDRVQKILFCADDRHIESVFVRGRLCVSNSDEKLDVAI